MDAVISSSIGLISPGLLSPSVIVNTIPTLYTASMALKLLDIPTLYGPSIAVSITKTQSIFTSTIISKINTVNTNVNSVIKLIDNPETYNTDIIMQNTDIFNYGTTVPFSIEDIDTIYQVTNTIKDSRTTSINPTSMLIGKIQNTYTAEGLLGIELSDSIYSPDAVILAEQDIPYDVTIHIRDTLSIPYNTTIELVIRNTIAYVVGIPLEISPTSSYTMNGIIVLRTPISYNPSMALQKQVPTIYSPSKLVKLFGLTRSYTTVTHINATIPSVYQTQAPIITDISNIYNTTSAISQINIIQYSNNTVLSGGIMNTYNTDLLISTDFDNIYGTTIINKIVDNINIFDVTTPLIAPIQNNYNNTSLIAIRDNHTYSSTSLIKNIISTDINISNLVALRTENNYSITSPLLLDVKNEYNSNSAILGEIITLMFASIAIFNIQENSSSYGTSIALTMYGTTHPVYIPINIRGDIVRQGTRVSIVRQGIKVTIVKQGSKASIIRLGSKVSSIVRQGARAIIKRDKR